MPAPSSTSRTEPRVAVIGGGPAGFFAAITAREANPRCAVTIYEQTARVLGKVLISGGGRCNITHDSPDPRALAACYPRGHRELIGPFTRFGAPDAVAWFTGRGVPLHTFPDGCLFPESNDSQTVIACLTGAARQAGVTVRTRCAVKAIARQGASFRLDLMDRESITADRVLIATGGRAGPGPWRGGYALAAALGHTIIPPVPSLFTFTISDPLLQDLAGIVVEPATVHAPGFRGLRATTGPLLITHWGLSGPAVLEQSAWGARLFHAAGYRFPIRVDWVPALTVGEMEAALDDLARSHHAKQLKTFGPFGLSRRLWERLVARAGLDPARRWADTGPRQRAALGRVLKATELQVTGQSRFKDEFVTAGGVPLGEIDLKTMQSRLVPGLFFAGEVTDIDGITGGFNFQACWTCGHLAGRGLARIEP